MSNRQNIYVAIVDDEESVCRSLGRFLRAADLQPITYPSAEAFLEDKKHPKFDCLVLDIQLGGMSGLELSDKLSADNDHTPVVFITAHDDPAARAHAVAAGCAGYFRKTDPGGEILAAINRAAHLDSSDTGGEPGRPTGADRHSNEGEGGGEHGARRTKDS